MSVASGVAGDGDLEQAVVDEADMRGRRRRASYDLLREVGSVL